MVHLFPEEVSNVGQGPRMGVTATGATSVENWDILQENVQRTAEPEEVSEDAVEEMEDVAEAAEEEDITQWKAVTESRRQMEARRTRRGMDL